MKKINFIIFSSYLLNFSEIEEFYNRQLSRQNQVKWGKKVGGKFSFVEKSCIWKKSKRPYDPERMDKGFKILLALKREGFLWINKYKKNLQMLTNLPFFLINGQYRPQSIFIFDRIRLRLGTLNTTFCYIERNICSRS